jgi:putative SOS response-associated peptidase YedK
MKGISRTLNATALLALPPDGTLRARPVNRAVNSPQNNEPALLEPAI